MLHPDVQLVGLSGDEIASWWRLALPPGVWTGRWALIVRGATGEDRGFALISGEGRRDIERASPDRLADLRRELGVDLAVLVDSDVFEALAGSVEPRVTAHVRDGYLAQSLIVYDALRRLRGRKIWSEPPVLEVFPPLQAGALVRGFDLLIPDNTSVVAYAFDDSTRAERVVHASVIALKTGGVIDAVGMHPAVADAVPQRMLRDWRSGYGRINEVVAERFAPPSLSIFADAAAIRRIQAGPGDQLSRELAQKNLIIDPMPAWLAGLVGGAAAAAIAGKSAQTLSKFLPRRARDAAGAFAGAARDRFQGANPLAVLGFDPILLWKSVQRWYRR